MDDSMFDDTEFEPMPEQKPIHDSEEGSYDRPFGDENDEVDLSLVDADGTTVSVPDDGSKFEIQVPLVKLFGKTFGIKKAVHENLTIAAVINSGLNDGSWNNKILTSLSDAQFEIIRGVFWNDDPNCQLFNNKPDTNRSYGKGIQWYTEFKLGKKTNLTQRSHFGDLQFIHAMGSVVGEEPQDTKNKLVRWLRIMYNLFIGNGIGPDTLVKNTELSAHFNDRTGHGGTTFKGLLMGTTGAYKYPNIQLRAIGSCCHVIEDSYAKGHCRRDNSGTGLIQNFHCYKGQDSGAHGKADGQGGDNPNPNNLDSFNSLYGGRAAINATSEFLSAAAKKQPWEQLVSPVVEKIFALHPNVTRSDTTV
ncbi:hypothetical protein PMZ80_002056 [Knufia obscura]|uniref:Uncharacterized protein n=2 Tax=Knufia TaxID=430999 RepID=A0AAN8I7X2_9EURO|nr:hypothetical protein PMZ80_002056 [Knufia obscura]KAK5953871.1 hypothetical protein OHC33_005142 [Knufia fluminis]